LKVKGVWAEVRKVVEAREPALKMLRTVTGVERFVVSLTPS
jgi:hypothetical protein